jgi:uracil-DNA glycosylase
MEHQGQLAASRMIDSLTSWWELAGVDAAVSDTPVNWLEDEAKVEATHEAVVPAPAANDLPTATPAITWPADIDTLKADIAGGAALPGNSFGSSFAKPVGPARADVMVISDLPDQDEANAGTLGNGTTGALLARMLAAIGITLADCYWTALATTIPPTGEVPESLHPQLAAFTLHQIGLVKPKSLILLGSSASKALLNEELMKARQNLVDLNHDGSNMSVLTTFHPRTLVARPAMKAQAWKDLQMFAKRADL